MTAKQESDRRFYLKHRERILVSRKEFRKVLKLRKQLVIARQEYDKAWYQKK